MRGGLKIENALQYHSSTSMGVKPETRSVEIQGTEEVRCGCGALLARYVPGGLELKCRRCRRVLCIRFEDLPWGPTEEPVELKGGCNFSISKKN